MTITIHTRGFINGEYFEESVSRWINGLLDAGGGSVIAAFREIDSPEHLGMRRYIYEVWIQNQL